MKALQPILIITIALILASVFMAAFNPTVYTTHAQCCSHINDSMNAISYTRLLNKPTLNSGTVTSVGLTSTDFDVSNTPITSSGNVTVNINSTSKSNWNSAYANMGKVILRNKSGIITSTGVYVADTFTISSTGIINLSSYLSANGFTAMRPLSVTGFRLASTVNTSPQMSIDTFTTTTVKVIATQQNTAVVTILGINVLSGSPLISVTDFANVKCYLSFIAY